MSKNIGNIRYKEDDRHALQKRLSNEGGVGMGGVAVVALI